MIFQRTEQLIGSEGLERLRLSKVAIFGIGGVGSYVFEGLVRSGIGRFLLVDKDVVDKTNINRQLVAYHSTVGQPKVEVAKNRGIDINPDVKSMRDRCSTFRKRRRKSTWKMWIIS